jgi:phosphoribosyl 1,2-cyclic phosphodiesterase
MLLHVLSSGSAGNGYILQARDEVLVVEAGTHLAEVKKSLGFRIDNIRGVLVSHEHEDHSAWVKEYADSGIDVLSHERVFETHGLTRHIRSVRVDPEKGYMVGGFRIIPFEAHHDCPCLGFHIHHAESGNIMFLTDSFMTEYVFDNLSHILIEANYSDEILEENILRGSIPAIMRRRLLQTHMEIKTCRDTILANGISRLQNIVLLHLSNGNSNEVEFIRTIKEATGIPNVFAASKNMKINLNAEPF